MNCKDEKFSRVQILRTKIARYLIINEIIIMPKLFLRPSMFIFITPHKFRPQDFMNCKDEKFSRVQILRTKIARYLIINVIINEKVLLLQNKKG